MQTRRADGLDVKLVIFKNWEQLKKKSQKLSNNNTEMKSKTHNKMIGLTNSMAVKGKKQNVQCNLIKQYF